MIWDAQSNSGVKSPRDRRERVSRALEKSLASNSVSNHSRTHRFTERSGQARGATSAADSAEILPAPATAPGLTHHAIPRHVSRQVHEHFRVPFREFKPRARVRKQYVFFFFFFFFFFSSFFEFSRALSRTHTHTHGLLCFGLCPHRTEGSWCENLVPHTHTLPERWFLALWTVS